MKRSARKLAEPDLGVLAARLLFGVQDEIFRRTAEQGFDDLRPRHGAVLAYLDDDGMRLADLARIAGRNKQTIAAVVDELEDLGYVYRADDPADGRAKLIVPTERGRGRIHLADDIVADIEKRNEDRLGHAAYTAFRQALLAITGHLGCAADPGAGAGPPGALKAAYSCSPRALAGRSSMARMMAAAASIWSRPSRPCSRSRGALGSRQVIRVPEHRPQQLVQSRERQAHLGLDPGRTQHQHRGLPPGRRPPRAAPTSRHQPHRAVPGLRRYRPHHRAGQ
jgi:DNA-binding MarR family transcriptional regulator